MRGRCPAAADVPFFFSSPSALLAGPLPRHLLALLPGLGQPDGNGLLAALHPAPLAALSAPQFAVLPLTHSSFYVVARATAVFPSAFSSCHVGSSLVEQVARALEGAIDVPQEEECGVSAMRVAATR